MKPKKTYLEKCIFPLAMFTQPHNFERMRSTAAQRGEVVLARMFKLRHDLKASEAGRRFVTLPNLDWPGIRQPLLTQASVDLPQVLGDTVAHDNSSTGKIDEQVIIPMMRIHAEKVLPAFCERLLGIIPGAKLLEGSLDQYAKHEKLVLVAPVKGHQRMQVQVVCSES